MTPAAQKPTAPRVEANGSEFALVFAGDEGVAQPLAVAVHSALANLSADCRPVTCLLDNGLTAASRTRLLRVVERTGRADDLLMMRIPEERLGSIPRHPRITAATYSRVLAAEVIPAGIRRAVYLDADVLVRRDLSPLFDLDLDDALVGGVREYGIPTIDHPRSGVRDKSASRPYFNAGVLVIDVGGWRNAGLTERVLQYAAESESSLPHVDQDALNGVIDRWQPIPEDWNMLIGTRSLAKWRALTDWAGYRQDIALYRRATVLHFRGGAKPWLYWCEAAGTMQWVRALFRTGWFTPSEALMWLSRWFAKRARYLPGIKARRWLSRIRASGH